MGYSRQPFYETRRNDQVYGSEGQLDWLPPSLRGGVGSDAHIEEVLRAVCDHVSLNRCNGQAR